MNSGNSTAFVDTNVLISGIFFDGLEAELLDSRSIHLVTAEVCHDELEEVAVRKSGTFGISEQGAVEALDTALIDIDIIPEEEYEDRYGEAVDVLGEGNDAKVFASVLEAKPDYFVTGDKDFHTDTVAEKVNVVRTREVLEEID
ncbi:MAG: PIN domain-containing protein [Halobacteria archaeon]|nr:PIN domain-containing protein [Halobacteria archaeon]